MKPQDGDWDRVISGLYEAALEPAHWQHVLPRLCEVFGCIGVTIITIDPMTGRVPIALSHGIDPGALQDYDNGVQLIDPLRVYALENPNQQLYFEYQHTPEESIDNSPFHQIMEQRTGIRYRFAAQLFNADGVVAYATLQRTRDQGHPDSEVLSMFSAFVPHLARAVRIANRIGNLDLKAGAAMAAMQDLPMAILLLNAERQLIYKNAVADRILDANDALILELGGLHALRRTDDNAVQKAISAATDIRQPTGGSLSVSRRSGMAPYAMQFVPLSREQVLFATIRPAAAVFIADPASSPKFPVNRISELFGLSPRQAELAIALTEGLTVAEAAERMSITQKTARSHLETLFKKTGTNRQAELVRLLLNTILPSDSKRN